jgi:hypothetical protein
MTNWHAGTIIPTITRCDRAGERVFWSSMMNEHTWHDPPRACLPAWIASYERLYTGQGYSSITCPCCSIGTVRIYWRPSRPRERHQERRRGSGWMWCGTCLTSDHWSGWVPPWWPEDDPLGNVLLHIDPRELDAKWPAILRYLPIE